LQQLIDGKRNRIQNRKYKDCAVPSVSKRNTHNQQNMGKKFVSLLIFLFNNILSCNCKYIYLKIYLTVKRYYMKLINFLEKIIQI